MSNKFAAIIGVLMLVVAATPVLPQGVLPPGALPPGVLPPGTVIQGPAACLQHNRMQSWKPIDEYTLDFTDLDRHHYTVFMRSRCLGATDPRAHLIFRTWLNLQCLPAGQIIEVQSPQFGTTQCSVAGVQVNLPFNPGYGTSD